MLLKEIIVICDMSVTDGC